MGSYQRFEDMNDVEFAATFLTAADGLGAEVSKGDAAKGILSQAQAQQKAKKGTAAASASKSKLAFLPAGICLEYTVKDGVTAKMWTGKEGQTYLEKGVGGKARIRLSQTKPEAARGARIYGKVLDGMQKNDAAWFDLAELDCKKI